MFHKLQSPYINVNFPVICIISNNRTPVAQKFVFPKVMAHGLLTPCLVLFSVSPRVAYTWRVAPALVSPPMADISSLITTHFF